MKQYFEPQATMIYLREEDVIATSNLNAISGEDDCLGYRAWSGIDFTEQSE